MWTKSSNKNIQASKQANKQQSIKKNCETKTKQDTTKQQTPINNEFKQTIDRK